MGNDLAGQGNTESPGSGRVRLRPNRGFLGCLVYGVIPQLILLVLVIVFAHGRQSRARSLLGRATIARCMGDDVAEQSNTDSPGSGRVRLRPNRGFLGCLVYGVIPQLILLVLVIVFARGRRGRARSLLGRATIPRCMGDDVAVQSNTESPGSGRVGSVRTGALWVASSTASSPPNRPHPRSPLRLMGNKVCSLFPQLR
jgi:hypothetical protein